MIRVFFFCFLAKCSLKSEYLVENRAMRKQERQADSGEEEEALKKEQREEQKQQKQASLQFA